MRYMDSSESILHTTNLQLSGVNMDGHITPWDGPFLPPGVNKIFSIRYFNRDLAWQFAYGHVSIYGSPAVQFEADVVRDAEKSSSGPSSPGLLGEVARVLVSCGIKGYMWKAAHIKVGQHGTSTTRLGCHAGIVMSRGRSRSRARPDHLHCHAVTCWPITYVSTYLHT